MTGTVETDSDTAAPDIAMMRGTIGRLLLPDGQPAPAGVELETLTLLLRGHMELIIPEIQAVTDGLPEDDVPRYCAMACLGESRMRLNAQPSPVPGGELAYARRLARALTALCDHYQALTGVDMCLACDKPIEPDEESLPYDRVSPSSGAARPGHIHARCKNTVRRR